MSETNKNSEKTVDNLRNEAVKGEGIMGGGPGIAADGTMPPMPPIVHVDHAHPIPGDGAPPLNPDGSVPMPWDGVILPDADVILPDSPIGAL